LIAFEELWTTGNKNKYLSIYYEKRAMMRNGITDCTAASLV